MKAKHARMVIGRKVDEWLQSLPEPLRNQVKDDVIVTGGCIVSLLLGDKPNDFDIYMRTREAALALAQHYVAEFKKNPPARFKNSHDNVDIKILPQDDRIKIVVQSAGIAGESGSGDYQYFEQVAGDESSAQFVQDVTADAVEAVEGDAHGPDNASKGNPPYRPVFLSANAITLSKRVQIIVRFFGEPEVIHKSYDYVHCTCWWDSKDRSLHLPPPALECILARELRYTGGSQYPVCAMIRVRKFLARGWNITAGQFLKIAWDIHKLDLGNYAVLEDQLIGVDSAYFTQVIELLRKHDPEKIDAAYLMEVIDKIF